MVAGISETVLWSERSELVRIATEVLRKKGVSNVIVAPDQEECVGSLRQFTKAVLILDWLMGEAHAVSILSANAKLPAGRLRPMMLVADQVTTQLVAICADYGVTQIYTEALTTRNLDVRLTALLAGESAPDELRQILGEVHELRSGGALSDAAIMLRMQLKKHPSHLKIKCELADTLLAMGHHDEALILLKGMEGSNPPYVRGIHLLGRALLKKGKFEEAVRVMAKSQLIHSYDADRHVDLGKALLNLERFKDARQSFDNALLLNPKNKEAKVGKGQSLIMDGAVNEALNLLKESASDTELASIFNSCAVMNMRKGRHQMGMDLYTSALAAVGNDLKLQSRLYFNMGLGYRRWGKKEKALEILERAKTLDPSFRKIDQQYKEIEHSMMKGGERPVVEEFLGGSSEVIAEDVMYDVYEPGNGDSFDNITDVSRLMEGHLEETLFGNVSVVDPKTKKRPA